MKYDEHNTGKHIDDIIKSTTCEIHNGSRGVACFYVFLGTKGGEASEAVCNSRIKKAGFNGEIQPGSLRQKAKNGNAYSRR